MKDITTGGYSEQPSKSKGRVLMLGPLSPAVGGITTFIEGVKESDLNRKYELISFGTERPTFRLVRNADDYTLMFRIGLIRLLKSAISTMSHLLEFPFVLTMNRPNIVHIHTASYWSFWENAAYSLVSKMLRKKVVFHIHGGLFDEFFRSSNVFFRFWIRKFLDMSDSIVVLSPSWKTLLMDIIHKGMNSNDRIVVLENFVNSSRFAQEREIDVTDQVNVLFVGGVGAKAKGIHDVLKALPIVVEKRKNIVFSFVACGNIDNYDITGNEEIYDFHAKFLDFVTDDEKIQVFAASDIFVLPSYSEGLPITMLEAMASGLPIVATSVGSIPEIIEEGKNGFLIDVGNYFALAEKILLLAGNKRLRMKMAENNMNKTKKRYDLTVAIKKLDMLYAQLLGGKIGPEAKV